MAQFRDAETFDFKEQPILNAPLLMHKINDYAQGTLQEINQRVSDLNLSPKQSFYTRCALGMMFALSLLMCLYILITLFGRCFSRRTIPLKSKST
jgi:hypothetical protein